jgi:glutathione synthase/RimK-type ligase-like ATP-grasp enzyme
MDTGDIALVTDHSSGEGSRDILVTAIELLTGSPPVSIDARHFMSGGTGRASLVNGRLRLEVPSEDLVATPSVVIVYEIPPSERRRFEAFQRLLRGFGVVSLGLDAEAWRRATEKDLTVERFLRDGIPHMETITLRRPQQEQAEDAFDRLGGDVWTRPTIGLGGSDVFHVTTREQLFVAIEHYETLELDWLIARDAQNFDGRGRRHQFRVVVLGERVIRACEHVQMDPDAPCNEAQGAASTVMLPDDLPDGLASAAISATRSVGLPFSGVDLAVENGVVVFEVNVHPILSGPGGLETVAVPYVEAHLLRRDCVNGSGTRPFLLGNAQGRKHAS